MSDPTPAAPAGPVQPTPRPEGETVAPSAPEEETCAEEGCVLDDGHEGVCDTDAAPECEPSEGGTACEVCGREKWRRIMPSEAATEASCAREVSDECADECYRIGYARLRAEAAAQTARVAELEKSEEGLIESCARNNESAYLECRRAVEAESKFDSLEKQLAEVTRERDEARAGVRALDGALRDCAIARHTDLALGHPNNISECPDWICKLSLRALHPSPEGSNAQADRCKPLVEALRGAMDLITSFASGAPVNRATIAKTQEKSRAALSSAPAAPREHK